MAFKHDRRWAPVIVLPLIVGACAGPEYRAPLPTLPTVATLPAPVAVRPAPPEVLPALPPEDPVKATMAALVDGIVKPRREWFRGATYMPPYHPNHNYLVYTPEGNTTNFVFSQGEKPREATCSDGGEILSLTWSSMGVGATKSWVLKAKAKMTAPRQDCTITTTRGIYGVVIQPTTKTHTSKVQWSDPYSFLSEADPEAPDLCAKADTNYAMFGDEGAFGLRPGDVSNDGTHTCIRFPQSAAIDLPAVWLIEGGNERPASPSMIDNAYLIDGVPPVIELRTDTATIRIERAMP